MGDKLEVKILVEGGRATPAPPLGPSLAPLKVNVGRVVADINEKTKETAGMQVPVTVVVDTRTKEYEIRVGTPPVSALIKKELKLQKGSEAPGIKRVGDLTEEQVKKIARVKFGSDGKGLMNQVIGTARSMGITVGKGVVTEEELRQAEQRLKEMEAEAKPAEGTEAGKEGGAEKPAEGGEAGEGKEGKEAARGEEKKPAEKKATEKK